MMEVVDANAPIRVRKTHLQGVYCVSKSKHCNEKHLQARTAWENQKGTFCWIVWPNSPQYEC